MNVWYDQWNRYWADLRFTSWTETIEESDTIDLDYYGLTDDEVKAFNDINKDIYYENWLSYVEDWD